MTQRRPESGKHMQTFSPLLCAAYSACGWTLLFAAVHLYWALGGTFGLPPGKPIMVGGPLFVIDLVAIPLCLVGAVFALTLVQPWGKIFPRRLLLIAAWGGCAFLMLHAAPVLIEGGLTEIGLLKRTLSPLDRWDLIVYEPFWLLGGILFGGATWFYQRQSPFDILLTS